jgi:septal ring factor EnvC (AmiA/AmiB activator)
VVAPRAGRIGYAGVFRAYLRILILDHGGGWTTLITNLANVEVPVGQSVNGSGARPDAGRRSEVTVELRRNGQPVRSRRCWARAEGSARRGTATVHPRFLFGALKMG